jgi:acyl-CoA hydrolase
MKKTVEIKWPWTMVWIEYADEIIAQIKEALPPDHELQSHDIFPRVKWERRPIFIVDDDTTGESIHMNFEKMKRWQKTKFRVPTMKVLKNDVEVAEMIERDHLAECAKYNEDGTLK